MPKKNIRFKNKAFTLAEVIFSIFISILVILVLQNLLVSLKTANNSTHRTDDVVFAYVQFNRFLHEDGDIVYAVPESSTSTKAKLVKQTNTGKNKVEKIYVLEKYRDMIRSTTNTGGHMPLLLNVKDADFLVKDEQLKITIVEKDGRRSELYFKVDPKPKKDKKKDEKVTTKKVKKTES